MNPSTQKHRSQRMQAVIGGALLVFTTLAAQTKDVVGYYPSWSWKARKNFASVARIPFDRVTTINYAFFFPRADGTIAGRDTAGDRICLDGSGGTSPRLVDECHRHGVRVLLSIGGWEDSDNFPAVAASSATRIQFAASCLHVLRRYAFDGIDIDWEYPCFVDHKGAPADRDHATLLFKTLRDSLDAESAVRHEQLSLTAAVPAMANQAAGFDLPHLVALLDRFNVMTYDFNGGWDPRSGHNAPLFAPDSVDTLRNVDAAFRLYAGTWKLPPAKINLGVPFYGHVFAQCTALGAPHAGEDHVHFPPEGAFDYLLKEQLDRCTKYWDAKAGVPYYVQSEWKDLISCEDERSVALKAEYVKKQGAAGLIIWEITGDLLPDGSAPLLDAITKTFRNTN